MEILAEEAELLELPAAWIPSASDVLIFAAASAISVLLYWLTYRQTIGARKERTRAANTDIESILFRRVVVEGYDINPQVFRCLIEGKARERQILTSGILTENEFVSNLVAKVLDSDLIKNEERDATLTRLLRVSDALEQAEVDNLNLEGGRYISTGKKLGTSLALVSGLAASLVGTVSAVLGSEAIGDASVEDSTVLIIALFISLLATSVAAFALRWRDAERTSGSFADMVSDAQSFESSVASTIERAGFHIIRPTLAQHQYDLIFRSGSDEYVVEVKNWTPPKALSLIAKGVMQTQNVVESCGAKHGFLVLPEVRPEYHRVAPETKVSIVDLKGLRRHLWQLEPNRKTFWHLLYSR